jgi:hypothetical protein
VSNRRREILTGLCLSRPAPPPGGREARSSMAP